jgi:hypothetical protein
MASAGERRIRSVSEKSRRPRLGAVVAKRSTAATGSSTRAVKRAGPAAATPQKRAAKSPQRKRQAGDTASVVEPARKQRRPKPAKVEPAVPGVKAGQRGGRQPAAQVPAVVVEKGQRPESTTSSEEPVLSLLKRHEIQVLRKAGHSRAEVGRLAGVSPRTVQRVDHESEVTHTDDKKEHEERRIGRPSKAEPFREFVMEQLGKEPELMSLEILRRAQQKGYPGSKSALYGLIAALRPKPIKPVMRFDGVAGEF